MKTKLIMVGGFLGAGKTSLLSEMSGRLSTKGENVGLITNDQETGLVDTVFLEAENDLVKEVSGSCFCCNFGGFADAIAYIDKGLGENGIILAEPVGSCTDLSATLMQPLKEKYNDKYALAPLTVLADPDKIKKAINGWDSEAAYIIAKQFEEADVILINKIDLLSREEQQSLAAQAAEKWENAKVMTASVQTGEGLDEWLSYVLTAEKVGERILDIDYDIYAAGEAAFGWVNSTYEINADGYDFAEVAEKLLAGLADSFDSKNIVVGHVKFLLHGREKVWLGNITGNEGIRSMRSYEKASAVPELIINARVESSPENIEKIIAEEVGKCFASDDFKQVILKSLIPGRPNPTYRYDHIV